MMLAAMDIHKHVFQVAVLDTDTGEIRDERFVPSRSALAQWAARWHGHVSTVAIEATNGWRWVCQQLQEAGFDVRLADPVKARALRGRTRPPKTDRLDARWLVFLLAKQMLPEAWIPPLDIQRLRDQTRLRLALSDDRRRWLQRLHAFLQQEGWPCQRARLATLQGRLWVAGLELPAAAKAHTAVLLRLISGLDSELETIDGQLRRFAHADQRCQALTGIFGVGPILACHILAELGDALRFRRARQVIRAAGLDPVVDESADHRRRGSLAKQGSPQLRWALVEAAHHASSRRSPDRELFQSAHRRLGTQRAALTVARKIGRRAYHVLRQLEPAAA